MLKNIKKDNEMSLEGKVVGFLGFGYMAQSLAKGFITQKILSPTQITFFDRNQDLLKKISTNASFTGCMASGSNEEVVEGSDVIILAVKPQVALPLLKDIYNEVDSQKHTFVSICAGITIEQLQDWLPRFTKVVRTMPNTAVSVGEGMTVVCGSEVTTEEDCRLVEKLFSSVGRCLRLPEKQFDAVTAISGSGPAYAFMGLEAAGDAGALLGLPKRTSLQLAAQTMLGAAKMFLESEQHPGSLKDAVCSPGGTTLAGVRSLEKSSFRSVVMEAVVAAYDRSKQLEAVAAASTAGR